MIIMYLREVWISVLYLYKFTRGISAINIMRCHLYHEGTVVCISTKSRTNLMIWIILLVLVTEVPSPRSWHSNDLTLINSIFCVLLSFGLIPCLYFPLTVCTFHWKEGIPSSISCCAMATMVMWPTPWSRDLRENLIINQWRNTIPGLIWNLKFHICVAVISQLYLILKQNRQSTSPDLTTPLRKNIVSVVIPYYLSCSWWSLAYFPNLLSSYRTD